MGSCRQEVLAAVAALQIRNGGRPVSPQEIVREMQGAGTSYPEGTIRAEVVSRMCVNAPDNHATTWPDLRRVGRGQYVLNEPGSTSRTSGSTVPQPVAGAGPRDWPWEGQVQAVFCTFLASNGWEVTSAADTATKAHGVDVLALKGGRLVGAEVKGWPSTGYADTRRADEVKRTQPTTQAGHWFSQGLMKALMLLDSHPGHESLLVLPDYPRYRDLAERTRTGRAAAGVHVVLVTVEGDAASSTWNP